MKLLVCYKNIQNIPKAVADVLSENGVECVFQSVDKAETMRSFIRKNGISAVLSSEIGVLSKCNVDGIPKIYLSPDYCCTEKLVRPKCELYIIPSKELSFDFINSGAKDKKVTDCGLPVGKKYLNIADKNSACKKLGIDCESSVFTVFSKEASKSEVKATVKAILLLCEGTQVILAINDESEKTLYSTFFSGSRNVFVLDSKGNESLCLSVSDAVFSVANAEVATAVARQKIPLMLMHSSSHRYKENSRFFDKRGIGFEGKTAADNASYAGRLLHSQRLKNNMMSSQEKYIPIDSEQKIFEKICTFLEKLH